uniref:Uncharacterized protein n=1 Tax=Tanacetum cinerariifolium TaxID=118510 RepID=A0A699GK34_TANCI|nr:hypothetical protein [Tanacetum cinerariifolium]
MENANPFVPTPLNKIHARITQELNELQEILAMFDSRLENIGHTHIPIPPHVPFEQLLDDFMNPPNVLEKDDLELNIKSNDTPIVLPFLDSDEDSDDEEDIEEFITSDMADVVMGRPFRAMLRTIPRLKNFNWIKVPPILELSQRDLMSGLRYSHEKNKFMYKNCLNLGPEYQVDESMKEWLIRGHVSIDGVK